MSWLELAYNVFTGIGVFTVILFFIIVAWSILLARGVKKDKAEERTRILDMLDPSKRAEKIEELIHEAEEQTRILKQQQKTIMKPVAKAAEEVIDKATNSAEGIKDGEEKR